MVECIRMKSAVRTGIVVLLLHLIAETLYWYSSIWYFDMILHFLGGMFIVYLLSAFKLPMIPGIIIFFTILLGWEFFEFSLQHITFIQLVTPLDSLSDFLLGTAGGIYVLLQKRDTL
jgi:hypothetical protein